MKIYRYYKGSSAPVWFIHFGRHMVHLCLYFWHRPFIYIRFHRDFLPDKAKP